MGFEVLGGSRVLGTDESKEVFWIIFLLRGARADTL